jgi:nitroimidazol reductase NimA-like FMN-containing flavoprotein (pyridoxamine 5'-phosphate oxidase superfamily)
VLLPSQPGARIIETMNHESLAGLDWSGLTIIDRDDCYEHLRHEPVGRLGFVDHGGPVILPVNFALDGHGIVFRTGQGSKLSVAIMEQPVCLEVDSWDVLAHTGWSVLAKGMASEVLDQDRIDRFEDLPVRPWSRPDLRSHWVRVTVEEISGRRIAPVTVDR